ncbi:MAG: hypothetical protein U0V72_13045 [Cytophagales bacterium]
MLIAFQTTKNTGSLDKSKQVSELKLYAIHEIKNGCCGKQQLPFLRT